MAGLLDNLNLSNDLFNFKRDTNNQMNKVKGDVLNPIDVTTQKLDQGVALTNNRDTTLKGRITNYRSSVVEQLDGIIGAISGGLLNTKDLTKAVKIGPDGVRFDTDDLWEAAGRELGIPVYGGFAGAQRAVAGIINKEFTRLTGFNVGQVITTKDGTFAIGKNWRTTTGRSLLNILKDYTGIDEFVDVSVSTATYNAILYNSGIFGMRDSYQGLWDNYPYKGLRQDAFIEAMQYMITNGDIESIDKVMSLLDEQGKNALLNKYPTFIATLFSKFHFDKDVYPEDYDALRTKLLAIVVRVAGPNWMYRTTQFGQAYDLGLTNHMSPDMVTLLSPVEELVPLLCTVGLFSANSAWNELNKQLSGPLNYL